jgi:hypothetical protein
MNTKFKIGNSATCTCGRAPQTAGHILQNCYEHDVLRQTYWPTETPLICTRNNIADIDIKLLVNERRRNTFNKTF